MDLFRASLRKAYFPASIHFKGDGGGAGKIRRKKSGLSWFSIYEINQTTCLNWIVSRFAKNSRVIRLLMPKKSLLFLNPYSLPTQVRQIAKA